MFKFVALVSFIYIFRDILYADLFIYQRHIICNIQTAKNLVALVLFPLVAYIKEKTGNVWLPPLLKGASMPPFWSIGIRWNLLIGIFYFNGIFVPHVVVYDCLIYLSSQRKTLIYSLSWVLVDKTNQIGVRHGVFVVWIRFVYYRIMLKLDILIFKSFASLNTRKSWIPKCFEVVCSSFTLLCVL